MAKKNTDTVPAMLTPGEFVIKRESAKKIGYSKLNQINKTGKVNNKKEAKMPQGKGTYGSQAGRPPKKAKGYAEGGKAKKKVDKAGQRFGHEPRGVANTIYEKQMKGEKLDPGFETEYSKSGGYRAYMSTKPYGKVGHLKVTRTGGKLERQVPRSEKETVSEFGRSAGASALTKAKAHIEKKQKAKSKTKKMQMGGIVQRGPTAGLGPSPISGAPPRMRPPVAGPSRGYSKGGEVTSEGYAVHGESDKYKAGE